MSPELWVTDEDVQIFRPHCLHLFLCADWPVRYPASPQKGPLVIETFERMRLLSLHSNAASEELGGLGRFMGGLLKGGFTMFARSSQIRDRIANSSLEAKLSNVAVD